MSRSQSRSTGCRHHIALGDLVADLVRHDSRFETVTPPRFALTCFCLKVSVTSENLNKGQASQWQMVLSSRQWLETSRLGACSEHPVMLHSFCDNLHRDGLPKQAWVALHDMDQTLGNPDMHACCGRDRLGRRLLLLWMLSTRAARPS